MRYGKFFNLNYNTSSIEYGISMYDYTGLTAYDDLFPENGKYKMLPLYPIRLVITQSSVRFILHYSTYRRNCNKKLHYSENPFNAGDPIESDSEVSITHIEETIIELPFSGKGYENLTSIIGKLYCSEFPLRNDSNSNKVSFGNGFLLERIEKQYEDSDGKGTKIKSQNGGYYHIHAYSSLDCKNLRGEWKTQPIFDKEHRCTGFLRKLMLDFMFDIVHSDVFQNSPNFNDMYTGLTNNFYFSALLHKYEYHFYRQLLWEELSTLAEQSQSATQDPHTNTSSSNSSDDFQGDQGIKGTQKHHHNNNKPSIVPDNKHTLYAYYKSQAEKRWVQDIVSPEAENSFYTIREGWKNRKKSSGEEPAGWFCDPESEMRIICFPDIGEESRSIKERKRNKKNYKHVYPEHFNKKTISQWFLGRYDFQDAFHFHQPSFIRKPTGPILIILAALFTVVSIVPWPCAELPVYFFLIALVLGIIIVAYKFIRGSFANILHLFFPRLTAAIATGWITLAIGFDLFASFFDINVTSRLWNVFYVLGFVFILGALLVYKINQSAPQISPNAKYGRAGTLILFGFCISMGIGMIVVDFLGERYLVRGGDIDQFYAELDERFFSYEGINREKLLYQGDADSLKATREEQVNGLTKTYHVVGTNKVLHNHPVVVKTNILSDKCRLFSFFYLRDFTVLFSFIALFIGIFIQLVIFGYDKQITEV